MRALFFIECCLRVAFCAHQSVLKESVEYMESFRDLTFLYIFEALAAHSFKRSGISIYYNAFKSPKAIYHDQSYPVVGQDRSCPFRSDQTNANVHRGTVEAPHACNWRQNKLRKSIVVA